MSIDWNRLQEPFDILCSTLLSTLGLHVEPGPVGSQSMLRLPQEVPPIRVVCWSQGSSAPGSSVDELLTVFANLVEEAGGPLVVFTNALLPDTAKRALEGMARSARSPVSIGYVEGSHLERLLLCSRQVYRRYFNSDPMLREDLDCNSLRSARALCKFIASDPFLQKDTTLNLEVENPAPAPIDLVVTTGESTVASFTVGSFGRQTVTISPGQVDPRMWSSLEVRPVSEPQARVRIEKKPEKPRLPIDYIYVDPLGWRETVRQALAASGVVYLAGGPGSGKSRLLREACEGGMRPAWIDLSEGSYGTAFGDHLLAHIFDLELETLRRLPETFILGRLEQLACDEIGQNAVLRYVKDDLQTLGMSTFAAVLAQLANAALGERGLVIDNVHKLRYLDAELLRALLTRPMTGPIVFTARDREIDGSSELVALLDWGTRQGRFLRVTLDELPTSWLIDRFLDEAVAEESSRRFLSVLRNATSMQQFMLAIKSFKARALIEQDDDGGISVVQDSSEIHLATDGQLLADMLAAIGGGARTDRLTEALEAAACYGFTFSLEFLREVLGDDAEELLDLLAVKELISRDEAGRGRFDHELTWGIVRTAIPFPRKERLLRQVITFREDPVRYRPSDDDAALAEYYEEIRDYGRSADYALSNAALKVQRSSLLDGNAQYEHALAMAERLREGSESIETDARAYVLEARALVGWIDTANQLWGAGSVFDKVRQLHVLMKLYPGDDSECLRLQGRTDFYFGRHFNLAGKHAKARQYLQRAQDTLREAGAMTDLGETLTRACTLEKNCCRFAEAERYGWEAVEILEQAGDLEKLAEALIDLGAVFLEAGEPEKTVPLWKRAVDTVRGLPARQAVCATNVEYSYILALVAPDSLDAEDELNAAWDLALRLGMEQEEARARLNFANWLFFHGSDPTAAREHLARADHLITKIGQSYLRHLHSFSLLNMDFVEGDERQRLEAAIEDEACGTVEIQGGLSTTGDNRVLNMIEYLARRGVPRILRLLPIPEGSSVEDYYRGVANPYRRGDAFITLY